KVGRRRQRCLIRPRVSRLSVRVKPMRRAPRLCSVVGWRSSAASEDLNFAGLMLAGSERTIAHMVERLGQFRKLELLCRDVTLHDPVRWGQFGKLRDEMGKASQSLLQNVDAGASAGSRGDAFDCGDKLWRVEGLDQLPIRPRSPSLSVVRTSIGIGLVTR